MNDTTSTDMEMESSSPQTQTQTQNEVAGDLLALARQLIQEGNPSQALQAVVMAVKTKGGEQAVLYILQRARELYRSKLQSNAEADQLASLFAECAIAEAQPVKTDEPSAPSASQPIATSSRMTESDNYGKSILAETGRQQIMLDAFSDGSSFICLRCGGLVSNYRKDEHYGYWCQI